MSEEDIKQFGAGIQRLLNGEHLNKNEIFSMFSQVLTNSQPDLQQGAFLAALVSKGETVPEIVGAWQAIDEFDTVEVNDPLPYPLVENSGTGMDTLKTFNVSSAAAIVAAACDVPMARHGARALTSFCGTVDILETMGLDVECDVETVIQSIKKEGIGLFNGMSPQIHPAALGRILSQIRFGSTLNIAASLANPAKPTHCVRGVYTEGLVSLVAEVMPKIGYQKGMVLYGKADGLEGGMDELSITGESVIQEFADNELGESYTLRPQDVGLKTASFEEIATTGDLEEESSRFIKVLAGNNYSACVDFTCFNAGAILYVADRVESIKAGLECSREAIENGSALNKLKAWVASQNSHPEKGLERLEQQLNRAGIKGIS